MRIVVFGAAGRTGQHLVEQTLAAGHEVTAFVRDPSRLALRHEKLAIIQGDVADIARVEQAVASQDAVISTLGPSRNSPPDIMEIAAANIVAAMKKQGVRRLIWQTGAGVKDEGDQPSFIRAVMIGLLRLLSPQAYASSERAFQLIKASGLDWTVVRVPVLADGPKQGGYRVGFAPPKPRPMSRADVAEFMLKQLTDPTYVRRAPMIGY